MRNIKTSSPYSLSGNSQVAYASKHMGIFHLIFGFQLAIYLFFLTPVCALNNLVDNRSSEVERNHYSVSSGENKPSDPQNLLQKARDFWNNYQYDSARQYYEATILMVKDSSSAEAVESLLGICNYHYFNYDVATAQKVLFLVEKKLKNKRLPELIGLYWMMKGSVNVSRDFENAGQYYQKALQLMRKDQPAIIELYRKYVDYLYEAGDFKKAYQVLKNAFNLNKQNFNGNKKLLADLILMKGIGYQTQNFCDSAFQVYNEEFYPLLQESNQNQFWVKYLLRKYYSIPYQCYLNQSDYFEAFRRKKMELKISKEIFPNDLSSLIRTLTQLALLSEYLENFELAKNYRREILARLKYNQEATNSNSIGLLYDLAGAFNSLGQSEKAFELYQEISEKPTPLDQYTVTLFAQAIYAQSLLLVKDMDYEDASRKLERFSLLGPKTFNGSDVLFFVEQSLKLEILQGLKKESELTKELIRTTQFYKNKKINTALNLLAIDNLNKVSATFTSRNEWDSVLVYTNKVILENQDFIARNTSVRESRIAYRIVNAYRLKAKALKGKFTDNKQLTQLIKALETVQEAIAFVQKYRSQYKSPQDKQEFNKNQKEIYQVGIELAYELYQLTSDQQYADVAFTFLEKAKSAELLESLNRNHAIQKTNIPDTLLLKLSSYKAQNSFLETQINQLSNQSELNASDSAKIENYQNKLLANKSDYRDLVLLLEEEFPSYYDLNYRQAVETASSVRAKLQPHEALVEYFETDEGLFVFVISHDQTHFLRLPAIGGSLVQQWKENIQTAYSSEDKLRDFQQFSADAFQLYQALLEQPLKSLKSTISKLYLVPDRSLNYIPFETLLISPPTTTTGSDYKQLDYLINHFDVSYGYSSTILLRETTEKRAYKGSLFALAPSYSDILNDTTQLAQLGTFRDGFAELFYNKEEVNEISQYFDGQTFQNALANERQFIENLENHDILHLAMHALLDEENPRNSRLVFSPTQQDSIYDNYLHSFELYNMDIKSQLTVLSACNTGSGTLLEGEGVMSLARAFTYAGSESVVMSHWKVDDQASKELMKYFYKHLSEGLPKSAALRQAKLDYLSQADIAKSHPFYWSAFVLFGNDAPIIKEENKTGAMILIAGLLLAAVMSFSFWRSRRKQKV